MSEQTSLNEALGLEDVREDEQEAAPEQEAPPESEQRADDQPPAEGEADEAAEGREDAPEGDQPTSVPHARFNAELQRRKELEAELEQLKQAKPKSAPDLSHLFKQGDDDQLPDPIDNPQGYQSAIQKRFEDRLWQQGWNVSQAAATRHYGADAVETALSAFSEASKQNPLLEQAARQSADPVGEIVNWHKTQQEWAEIQQAGGLQAYRERILAEAQTSAPQTQAQDQSQPAAPKAQPMPSDMATTRNAAPRDGGFAPADLTGLLNAP